MRHRPANSARPTPRPSDSGIDANRAGIRALDCGDDEHEDGVSKGLARADESKRQRSPVRDGSNSFGEPRQTS